MSVLSLPPIAMISNFAYMSMYIYHVNNGDDNLNGIICA